MKHISITFWACLRPRQQSISRCLLQVPCVSYWGTRDSTAGPCLAWINSQYLASLRGFDIDCQVFYCYLVPCANPPLKQLPSGSFVKVGCGRVMYQVHVISGPMRGLKNCTTEIQTSRRTWRALWLNRLIQWK